MVPCFVGLRFIIFLVFGGGMPLFVMPLGTDVVGLPGIVMFLGPDVVGLQSIVLVPAIKP